MSGIYPSRERSSLSLSDAFGRCYRPVSLSAGRESHPELPLSDQADLDYVLKLPEILVASTEGTKQEEGSYLPCNYQKLRPCYVQKQCPLSDRPKPLRYSHLLLLD